jgi:hypothetical protein
MAKIGNPGCGTAGCIIGWTLGFIPRPEEEENDYPAAIQFLGLNRRVADLLTMGDMPSPVIYTMEITKEEVLAAMDSTINIGVPVWPARVQRIREGWLP